MFCRVFVGVRDARASALRYARDGHGGAVAGGVYLFCQLLLSSRVLAVRRSLARRQNSKGSTTFFALATSS